VPCYNRAALLKRAVNSVLAQTLTDFELIIVDDGSTDDTAGVLRQFSDVRIRLLRNDENEGAARARNRGIQAARGEWVAFLDSDDEWLPQRLECQMEAMERGSTEAAVAYCPIVVHSRKGGKVSQPLRALPEGAVLDDLLRNLRPPTASAFMVKRRALLEVGGFDEAMSSGHDIDLWLRLAQEGYHFSACNEALVVWHWHDQKRVSTDPGALVQGYELFQQRWGPVMKQQIGYDGYCRWKKRRSYWIRLVLWSRVQREMRKRNVWAALSHAYPLLLFGIRLMSANLCLLASRWRR
jgi:glycosyltransferase involved in cell wall biosynthesis